MGGHYLLRRLIQAFLTIIAIVILNFFLFRMMPGSPERILLRNPHLTQATVDAARERWGLDQPVPVQLVKYLAATAQGDLGYSFQYRGQPVAEVIGNRFWPTIILIGLAEVVAILAGLALGACAGRRRGGTVAKIGNGAGLILYSMPYFVIGMPLISLFSAQRMTTIPSDGEVGVAALQHRLAGTAAFSNVIVEARVNGAERSWKLSAKPLPSSEGRPTGWRGVGSEVSDARAREAEGINRERHLHHLATHDVLTEFPNRRAFLEAVSRMLEHAGHGPTTANAMAFIDLDHFKTINDGAGHSVGVTSSSA